MPNLTYWRLFKSSQLVFKNVWKNGGQSTFKTFSFFSVFGEWERALIFCIFGISLDIVIWFYNDNFKKKTCTYRSEKLKQVLTYISESPDSDMHNAVCLHETIINSCVLTLNAPRKKMHRKMSSAEVICCK